MEGSDPGVVLSLDEDLENVLRHIDFEAAGKLKDALSRLAHEMGEEVAEAWKPMRIETSNDGGSRPVAFGTREDVDPVALQQLAAHARETDVGVFSVGHTCLMNESGPNPETREQYVQDLAAAMDFRDAEELAVIDYPAASPAPMARARQEIVDEGPGEILRRAALNP